MWIIGELTLGECAFNLRFADYVQMNGCGRSRCDLAGRKPSIPVFVDSSVLSVSPGISDREMLCAEYCSMTSMCADRLVRWFGAVNGLDCVCCYETLY